MIDLPNIDHGPFCPKSMIVGDNIVACARPTQHLGKCEFLRTVGKVADYTYVPLSHMPTVSQTISPDDLAQLHRKLNQAIKLGHEILDFLRGQELAK